MNKFWQKVKFFSFSLRDFLAENKWALAKAFAYLTVVIVFYFIFLWFLFPYNEISTILSNEIKSKTTMDMSVKKSEGAFPIGLKLTDVLITKKTGDNESPVLEAHTFELTPAVLSLFKGWLAFKIHAALYNGQASLEMGSKKTDFYFDGVIKNIYIDRYSLLKSNYGLNMDGILNVKWNIKGSLDNAARDSGNCIINIKNASMGHSTLSGILTLPKINFGDISLPVFVKDGRVDIQNATQASKDINSQLEGSIILANPAGNSVLNLKLKFNPTPEMEQQMRKTIPFFMLTRDASGYFNLSVTGNLNAPRFNQ